MARVERALWTIVIFVCSYFFIASFKANDEVGATAGISIANIIAGVVVTFFVIGVLYVVFAWWSKSQKDKALSNKNPTDSKTVENNKVATTPTPKNEKIRGWWAKKSPKSKEWSWYIIIVLIAYVIALVTGVFSGETNGVMLKAVTILLGFHAVWFFIVGGEPSKITKIVVGGMALYFVLAWLVPSVVIMRDSSLSLTKKVIDDAAQAVKTADDNYGKTSPTEAVEAPTAKTPEGKTEVVQYDAYTGGWTEIPVKQGVNVEVRCPTGKVLLMATSREHPKGSTPWDCQQKAELGSVNDLTYFAQATEGVQPVIVKSSPWWSQ